MDALHVCIVVNMPIDVIETEENKGLQTLGLEYMSYVQHQALWNTGSNGISSQLFITSIHFSNMVIWFKLPE